jgi:deoxyribodipyrimidine photo-lyase
MADLRCPDLQIVWFKRDLRVEDHAPLAEAARLGPVLPLYVAEPELWRQPDAAGRHWAILAESLAELRSDLTALGQPLAVRSGDAVAVLEDLRCRYGVAGLWSHQETGNGWTFARDRRVRAWARSHGIPWHEPRQFGVERGRRDRTGWAQRWDRMMAAPPSDRPAGLPALPGLDPGPIPRAVDLGLADDPCPGRQPGGRAAGVALLESFLGERGRHYAREMSSPLTAVDACSRLSIHLAAGTLSMREISQAALARLRALKGAPEAERRGWAGSLKAFHGRLHWHCHFIQKLEDEPRLEFENLHPAYDGLRGFDEHAYRAWAEGRTGWPFVDACMRCLRETGWINFRMRAMLMAVSSYHLWQHWREPSLHLARLFADYEPGIHWPQAQMQSGTTGINTVRIYNPVKQGRDHDPEGAFVRRWCPELSGVPAAFVHEPWRMSAPEQEEAGCRLGRDWPEPIADHLAAARAARDRVWAVRRSPEFKARADAIQDKHGSRRSGLPPSTPAGRRRSAGSRDQLDFGV